MADIEFRASGLEELFETLADWQKRLESNDKLGEVSSIMLRSTMENYERRYDSRRWPKRKYDGTMKANPWPILLKTGLKRQTELTSIAKPWQKTGEGYQKDVESTSYGKYHQFGTSRLPIRASVYLQDPIQEEIRKTLNRIFGPNSWAMSSSQ